MICSQHVISKGQSVKHTAQAIPCNPLHVAHPITLILRFSPAFCILSRGIQADMLLICTIPSTAVGLSAPRAAQDKLRLRIETR